ncbi:MAG: DUF975 family protein [Lachnospiraceae bacterium]|nr:DUF975 family protein [Lachnospiraceae bacterium]
MVWSISELKARARETLKLCYWPSVAAAFILGIVSGGVGGSGAGSSSGFRNSLGDAGSNGDVDYKAIVAVLAVILVMALVITIIASLISIFAFVPLRVGTERFFLEAKTGTYDLNNIGFAFNHSYMNIVKIMFQKSLYTVLWSMLFIIPGIIKTYEYSMIPYILMEHPDIDSKEAFRLSKQMMDGDKWNLFVLQLSFIGWHILSLFTCFLLSIFYVNPYLHHTLAEFYGIVKHKAPFHGSCNVIDLSYPGSEDAYATQGAGSYAGDTYSGDQGQGSSSVYSSSDFPSFDNNDSEF